jgi:hypothetical protein
MLIEKHRKRRENERTYRQQRGAKQRDKRRIARGQGEGESKLNSRETSSVEKAKTVALDSRETSSVDKTSASNEAQRTRKPVRLIKIYIISPSWTN